jgi:hypothetical protein
MDHLARRRGLVVRVKTHVQKVVGSNPGLPVDIIYHVPLIWIKSMKAKNCGKVTLHCCMCCNPAKGRVEFEGGWLMKSSFITKDEMQACQLTRTKKNKSSYGSSLPTVHQISNNLAIVIALKPFLFFIVLSAPWFSSAMTQSVDPP